MEHVHGVLPGVTAGGLCVCSVDLSTPLTEKPGNYLAKLGSDGVLAFHISNHYLNLEPLLAGLSRRAGLSAFIRRDGELNVTGRYPSWWVVMARRDAGLGTIPSDSRWASLQGNKVWTDDFSNILSLLEWRQEIRKTK